jgi:hypothetical protein
MKKLTKIQLNELFKEEREEYFKRLRIEENAKIREKNSIISNKKSCKKYSKKVKEITKLLQNKIAKDLKVILRSIKRKQKEKDAKELLKEKRSLDREERVAKQSQRLVVEFIKKYGEETFYEYKRSNTFLPHVSNADKKLLIGIFEKGKKIYPSTNLEPLSWKDSELETLSEIANFGDIIKIRFKNRPIYMCNDVLFLPTSFRIDRGMLYCYGPKNVTFDYVVGKLKGENEILIFRIDRNKKDRKIYLKIENKLTIEEVFALQN